MKCIGQKQIVLKNTLANWRRVLKGLKSPQVFGLDIGASAVKIVQLSKNDENYSVTAAGIAYVGGVEGDGNKEINIQKAIHQCLQSAGVKTKLAVCGVGGPETVVRHFAFPLLLPDEIEGAVQLEAKQVCPFNTDDGVVDYQLIQGDEKQTVVILVAATKKLLNEKAEFVKSAVVSNVLMDVDGLALLNCLIGCQEYEAGQATAILNVGHSYATLVIISDDNIPFVRDLSHAGKVIIDHIALENNVSSKIIEDVMFGREKQNDIELMIHDNLEPACDKLIIDIAETLCYDAVRRQSDIVKKIFLCGGFAMVDGFADLLNSRLPAAAVLWNPFDKISCDETLPCADILRKKGPAFAVAAGFAMRAI